MNWLGKMIGLPEDFLHRPGGSGGGVIQTTASEATLVCLLAARTRAIRDVQENDPDRLPTEINSRLVAYCSDQVCAIDVCNRLSKKLDFFARICVEVRVLIFVTVYLKICDNWEQLHESRRRRNKCLIEMRE